MRPIRNSKITLLVNPLVYHKMRALVNSTNNEIAWHGFTKKLNENTYYWYDIIIFPQYVTGATVTSDEDEYQKWLIKQMEYDNFEDMRLHGHSHVNMGVFPSGIDRQYRNDLLSKVKDYYIFMITNKKGALEFELYDRALGFCFESEDVKLVIGTEGTITEANIWSQKVITNNIKERSYNRCLTTLNQPNSSIQLTPEEKYTSLDAELLAEQLQNCLLEQE